MSELKVGEKECEATNTRKADDTQSCKVDRRSVLKGGVIAGAAAVITTKKTAVFAQTYPPPPPPPSSPVLCDPRPANSPATTPFVEDLPIPTPALPAILFPFPTMNANIGAGEAARDPHQRWSEFPPRILYESVAAPSLHTFHRDLSPTYLWTFNGQYPAPMYLGYYGLSQLVRFRNNLPVDAPVAGIPQLTVHLHNAHTPSESDGFAGDFFDSGLWKDNHYPNVYAGVDQFGGIGDPREAMRTFWYHDHRAEFTAPNNYLGLNGMFLLYDQKDPGHELPTPGSLRLPGYYGVTDIPLQLHAILFCPTANGRTEAYNTGAVPGQVDKWIVNGKIQPKLTVRRRKYRFRILNTGMAKEWNVALIGSDGQQKPFTVVAVDANFVETPFTISNRNMLIPVSSRTDFIIDFSQFAAGTSVYLREAQAQFVGVPTPDPAPGLPIGNVVMRFDVVNREPWFPADTPAIPSHLIDMPSPIVPDDSFEWRFTLDGDPVRFRINGQVFDHNRVDHAVLKGSSEEWTIANDVIAGNWTHPVHIHFEEGRIMSRTHTNRDASGNIVSVDNVPLLPEELGRRDVYRVPGQDRLVIRLRFRDFHGRYLIHCHNMNHEDNFMMVRWDIVETVEELTRKRREIDERRMMAGLPPQYGPKNGNGRLV
jgi:FtsP/CotA-like multicopper oxidase with cupredoxin domain